MIRGIYSAASGMIAEMQRSAVTANNLANANTTGYKKDVAVSKEFSSMLIQRINDGDQQSPVIGSLGLGTEIDEVATDQNTGPMLPTGNDFDLAINGKGFFAVQTPNGVRYTRNGTFTRNAAGELVTQDGYRVLGQNGPVRVNGAKFTITGDGRVTVDGVETNRLQVVDFADEKQLTKEGDSLFAASAGARPTQAAGEVQQGMLEQSNVNVVAEMVNMIAGYRAYEFNSKAVQGHDELLDKAVNEVGKV